MVVPHSLYGGIVLHSERCHSMGKTIELKTTCSVSESVEQECSFKQRGSRRTCLNVHFSTHIKAKSDKSLYCRVCMVTQVYIELVKNVRGFTPHAFTPPGDLSQKSLSLIPAVPLKAA